ncbi:hypothetical protein EX30DRAFT_309667, partial [Ascodesmis nigricans]
NKRFSRIDMSKVAYERDGLEDNTFLAAGFDETHYSFKAHQDLIVTKGKGFTKEKNKKKKGAYRGGAIDFTTRSIKFDD